MLEYPQTGKKKHPENRMSNTEWYWVKNAEGKGDGRGSYIWSVSISSKERILVSKKGLYFLQTTDLELLWVSINNFSLECVNKRVRIKEERTIW